MPGSGRPIIAVLGSAVQDGEASPALRSRVEAAASQWRIASSFGLRPYVFCLGGVGIDGEAAEAPIMASLLVALGVPRSVIIEEAHSRTTEENLLHLRAILSSPRFPEDWVGRAADNAPDPRGLAHPASGSRIPVTIVTSRFHMPRTLLMARHMGFDPRGVAAVHGGAGHVRTAAREIGALLIWGARSLRRMLMGWSSARRRSGSPLPSSRPPRRTERSGPGSSA